MTTLDKPLVLLWIPEPGPYRQALERAGLDSRVEIVSVPMAEEPAPDLLARCEALLGFRAGAGLLSRMPRLRWIQTITAGVEGWLALPDLPAAVTLTCARGTHRVQMPENILGALFHLTKAYAGIVLDQRERRWRRRVSETLAGKTLGILGLGVIGQELARKAEALEMRVIGTRRSPAPMPHVERVLGPEGTEEVLGASDFVLLLLPVTRETRGFMNAGRLKRM
jgi:phosphoglycerate dehydrogenase-like enzyme